MGLVWKIIQYSSLGFLGLYLSHRLEPVREPVFEKMDKVTPVGIYQKAQETIAERYNYLIDTTEAMGNNLEEKIK